MRLQQVRFEFTLTHRPIFCHPLERPLLLSGFIGVEPSEIIQIVPSTGWRIIETSGMSERRFG